MLEQRVGPHLHPAGVIGVGVDGRFELGVVVLWAVEKNEQRAVERDEISVREHVVGDAVAVDQGAAGRLEVFDAPAPAVTGEAAVPPRDVRRVDHDLALGGATDVERVRTVGQLEEARGEGVEIDAFEPGFHCTTSKRYLPAA